MSEKNEERLKLEFSLILYFTLYPLHPVNPSAPGMLITNLDIKKYSDRIKEFKQYLELKGSLFTKSNEFQSFYLLPYIANPAECKAFNKEFTKQWVASLRAQLLNYFSPNKNLSTTNSKALSQLQNNTKKITSVKLLHPNQDCPALNIIKFAKRLLADRKSVV